MSGTTGSGQATWHNPKLRYQERLAEGGGQMAQREPTLSDVAALAGVSVTTVSRVLNSRGYLSAEIKGRVDEAIRALNYRPNQIARSLLGQRTRMIGVIMPTTALPFFGQVTAEIENDLATRGYRTLSCNSFGRADREREYLQLLAGNRVDGIISGAHNHSIPEYATLRLPIVTVDRELSPSIQNVRAANEEGGRMATRLLLERGSHRPMLLTSTSSPLNRREAGYRSVLGDAGIEPLVATVEFHTPEPARTSQIFAALDAAREIDGVFATDDLAAATALEWARQRGVRVPDDVRVVGFDGTEAIRRALPGLSTIQQPIRDICRRAVGHLVSQIEAASSDEEPLAVAAEELPVTLIEGWTTGGCRAPDETKEGGGPLPAHPLPQ